MQNILTPQSTDTFVAMLIHDLKTPINSEILALELLLKDGNAKLFKPYQEEILNDVLNSIKFIKNLTENVLCKYKSESGDVHLHKEQTSVKKLVENCISEASYILNEKNQKIIFNCPENDIDGKIDILSIKRAINNLIANANLYSPKNSEIKISLKKENNVISFKITDSGCGINLKNLDRVFEKYVRLANEQKTAGTGLGLYVTKLIIDAHNGNINIDSKINVGTTISFNIPE